jgi:hypothetical protein
LPVKRDIPLHLDLKEVLRRAGARDSSRVRPEIRRTVLEQLAVVEDEHLLEPVIAYEFYKKDEIVNRQFSSDGREIDASLLSSLFPNAQELAVMVCTIGIRLENKVTEYFNAGEALRGTLLDGIGSAAVDVLSQEGCRFIAENARSRGYQASSPVNPGMPGFPVAEQWWLLDLVPSREIGLSLTTSGIMVPRKSTSMVIGIGMQMTTSTPVEVCARCSLKETCNYRIHVSEED